MAYQVESYIQRVEVENPDVVLGVDISFSDSAVFKPLFSTSDQATSNLKNLLLTRIGERYAQPNFGTELLNLVFMPNTSELKTDIEETIFNAVEFWLPYISIEKIDILKIFPMRLSYTSKLNQSARLKILTIFFHKK